MSNNDSNNNNNNNNNDNSNNDDNDKGKLLITGRNRFGSIRFGSGLSKNCRFGSVRFGRIFVPV